MFILIICAPLLMLSLVWHKFTENSQCILRSLIWILVSLYFAFFYLNGADWSIYYLRFLEGDPYSSFEFGFVALFKILLFASGNNFGLAIILFYLLAFGFLLLILKKYHTNEPLLLCFLFLIFGYTLILEQLRQFIACIIIFYSLLKYNENNSIKNVVVWILLASSFHASSVILLPVLALTSIKNVNNFICLTLVSIWGIAIIFLLSGYTIIDTLSDVNFVFKKISSYLEGSSIEIRFRWLNILDGLFILFYIIYRHQIDKKNSTRILIRIVFIGCVIHFFSGSIVFLRRVTFFFYFIAVYLICMSPNANTKRVYSIHSNNTLLLNVYFTLLLIVNFSSYFRNEYAPVAFQNMNYRIISLFDSELIHDLALSTYFEAMSISN